MGRHVAVRKAPTPADAGGAVAGRAAGTGIGSTIGGALGSIIPGAGTAAGAAASSVVIRSSCAGKDVNSDSAHVAADLAALVADARDRGHWCSWEEAIQE